MSESGTHFEIEPEAIATLPAEVTAQRVATPYFTAVKVQVPRELPKVRMDIMAEATLAGEACFYAWGSGKNKIEGPSIELAMIIARNFMNCTVVQAAVRETNEAWYFTFVFVDLEKGVALPREFRQSKSSTVHGNITDDERKMTIRHQIGQSKAIRNVIIRAVPSWLVDEAIETAKEGAVKRLDEYIDKNGIEGARQRVKRALLKTGVTVAQAELKFKQKFDVWSKETVMLISADVNALLQGMDSVNELYPEFVDKGTEMPDLETVDETPPENTPTVDANATVTADDILQYIEEYKEELPVGTNKKYNKSRLSKYTPEALISVMETLENVVEEKGKEKKEADGKGDGSGVSTEDSKA